MNDFLQVTVLAFIQGITEFLPISSSGHLLLPSLVLGWPDQGLTFDVAVHVGSLGAVILYFRDDLLRLLRAWILNISRRTVSEDSRLAWLLIAATVPAGVAGLLLNDFVANYARALGIIAGSSILFGLLLYLADHKGQKRAGLHALTLRTALVIGFAQALALIPGTSRSGITMTAALFCNLTREAAARFSFLLSIPIILATGLLKGGELIASGGMALQWGTLLYAMVVAGVVAYSCIHLFLKLIARIGFTPFVIYRIALGLVLFGVSFTL